MYYILHSSILLYIGLYTYCFLLRLIQNSLIQWTPFLLPALLLEPPAIAASKSCLFSISCVYGNMSLTGMLRHSSSSHSLSAQVRLFVYPPLYQFSILNSYDLPCVYWSKSLLLCYYFCFLLSPVLLWYSFWINKKYCTFFRLIHMCELWFQLAPHN